MQLICVYVRLDSSWHTFLTHTSGSSFLLCSQEWSKMSIVTMLVIAQLINSNFNILSTLWKYIGVTTLYSALLPRMEIHIDFAVHIRVAMHSSQALPYGANDALGIVLGTWSLSLNSWIWMPWNSSEIERYGLIAYSLLLRSFQDVRYRELDISISYLEMPQGRESSVLGAATGLRPRGTCSACSAKLHWAMIPGFTWVSCGRVLVKELDLFPSVARTYITRRSCGIP